MPSHFAYHASRRSGSGDLKNSPPTPRTFAIGFFPCSPQHDARPYRSRSFMACSQGHSCSLFCPDDPLELRTVVSDMIIRPERNPSVLVGLALELPKVLPTPPRHKLGAIGQRNVRDHATHDLPLQGALAHVARQPAGVLHDQTHAPGAVANGLGVCRNKLELRGKQRLPQEPLREPRHLALKQLQRRITEGMKPVPAADLDASELRVVVWFPVDVRCSAEFLLAPAVELQIIIDRMIAEPVNVKVLL